jgi:hypothetical protein
MVSYGSWDVVENIFVNLKTLSLMGCPPSFEASSVGRVLPILTASIKGIEKVINDTVARVILMV